MLLVNSDSIQVFKNIKQGTERNGQSFDFDGYSDGEPFISELSIKIIAITIFNDSRAKYI